MLAEDPDHRPPPALLRDPSGARGRRVAARPASRAQRSFKIGDGARPSRGPDRDPGRNADVLAPPRPG
jgi:hypothetical protein